MIRVGYVPHSKDLQHPADRRRLAAWALEKGVKLNVINPLDSDVLVLSNAANFNYWLKRAKQPVILDLVDGYLGEHPSFIKDVVRNIVRSIRGTSDLRWITYTNHLRVACKKSDAVIVASIEQKDVILKFNTNVHVILDDHSELDSATANKLDEQLASTQTLPSGYILWEGFGYTLKHFQLIAKDLDRFLNQSGWGMYLVTPAKFPRWGGYIGEVKTKSLIDKWFPLSNEQIEIVPWSITNLISKANRSDIAVIPIDSNDQFAAMKSENKLLSMWHLGLPTLFSAIPSYSRVAKDSNQVQACIPDDEWGESLVYFSQSLKARKELIEVGRNYILSCHNHEDLMMEWNSALMSLLAR